MSVIITAMNIIPYRCAKSHTSFIASNYASMNYKRFGFGSLNEMIIEPLMGIHYFFSLFSFNLRVFEIKLLTFRHDQYGIIAAMRSIY